MKKYSPIGELSAFAKQYADALAQSCGHIVSITDRDHHIAVSGAARKELLGQPVGPGSGTAYKPAGNPVLRQYKDKDFIPISRSGNVLSFTAQVICPIITEGDAVGAVIITSRNENAKMGEVEQKLASGSRRLFRPPAGTVSVFLCTISSGLIYNRYMVPIQNVPGDGLQRQADDNPGMMKGCESNG